MDFVPTQSQRQSARVDPQTCRAISREVSQLAKGVSGRGPLFVRTFSHEDVLVMIFRGFLTPAERSVADSGAESTVKEMRAELFESVRDRLVDMVERETGNKVGVVLYDIDPEHDTSGVIFVLEE